MLGFCCTAHTHLLALAHLVDMTFLAPMLAASLLMYAAQTTASRASIVVRFVIPPGRLP